VTILNGARTPSIGFALIEHCPATYLEHLLRLDQVARRHRFGGQLADQAIVQHVSAINPATTRVLGLVADNVVRAALELCGLNFGLASASSFHDCEVAWSIEANMSTDTAVKALFCELHWLAPHIGLKSIHMIAAPFDPVLRSMSRCFDIKRVTHSDLSICTLSRAISEPKSPTSPGSPLVGVTDTFTDLPTAV
jgi:hypothetical protein